MRIEHVRIFRLFLHYDRYAHIGSRLGIGGSIITPTHRQISRLICENFSTAFSFTVSNVEQREFMKGFNSLSDLLYCDGSIDSTKIQWHSCSKEQVFEYPSYEE